MDKLKKLKLLIEQLSDEKKNYQKNYQLQNRKKISNYHKEWVRRKKETDAKWKKKFDEYNKRKRAEYYADPEKRAKAIARKSEEQKLNRKKYSDYHKEYIRKRKEIDSEFKKKISDYNKDYNKEWTKRNSEKIKIKKKEMYQQRKNKNES